MNSRLILLTLVAAASATLAHAQTFCSVREPNRVIHEMFPDSTGFRTDILEITRENAVKLPADLPFVFDRFYRADKSRARKVGGAGLGLAIAKHLTQAHGGRVWAESAGRGKGATFTVALPTQRELSQA